MKGNKKMTITYTKKQAKKISEQYNRYAKSKISANEVWCLWTDNAELDMENYGYTQFEINRFESIDGCNHTVDIYKSEVDTI